MSKKLNLTFYGGVGEVTGANFLLENESTKILIDCGLIQGYFKDVDPNREEFRYNPSDIDYLLITHAHIDHIGLIGKLVKDGFKGEIYSTAPTMDIARFMLEDAIKISKIESSKKNQNPLYDFDDMEKAFGLWKTCDYHKVFELGNFSILPKDAGHILGSAIYEITDKNSSKKIAFTGDLGNSPTPLLKDTETITDVDYLVMESVYGDRNHEDRELRRDKLKDVINKVIKRGGSLLIPVFSLEKTQVLLYELNNLVESGQVPSVPVFLDSPLGIKITSVYAKYLNNYNEKIQKEIKSGDDIFDFPKLKMTLRADQSRDIYETKTPFILMASSGASQGGRITEHEKRLLPDKKNALLMIGFQIAGTLGRKIKEGAKTITIDDKKIKINAEIISIDGYSSHKDSDGLLDFVSHSASTLKKVFVVMGEPNASMFLAQKIRDNLDVEALVPEANVGYEI